MTAQALIAKAINTRDQSLAEIQPPLDLHALPNPLPTNVTGIPKDVLTEVELKITSYDVPELLEEIHSKRLSCVAVTKAFLRRAALAQRLVNCVTELLPARAIERAQYLDSLEKPVGPLHGLPISIKEHHGMKGCKNNCSFVSWIDNDPTDISGINEVLWQAGAVFYARTTQPQLVMHLETSSNIYGVTLNPLNLKLTPGGSSGGESALIGLRGSILGMGGDIGGSIRCPAANTGIYGFKPSPGRLSRRGATTGLAGQEGILGTHGPLSTSRSGLEIFMSTYLQAEPWIEDNAILPLPWRSIELPKKLKIAVMWSDGVVKPHPPILRALKEVASTLEKSSDQFELVDWIPWDHDRCWNITQALYFEDGGRTVKKLMAEGGEEALPLTKWVMEGENVKERTVEEVCALKVQRNKYRQAYNNLWLATGAEDGHPVDAILCPTGPGPAPPLGHAKYWSYTSQWNMLEYPGVVFPVTTVDQEVDKKDTTYVPINSQDKENYDLYEPSVYVDAPVGLQIVTRRLEDEKCLAILKVIEAAMGRM